MGQDRMDRGGLGGAVVSVEWVLSCIYIAFPGWVSLEWAALFEAAWHLHLKHNIYLITSYILPSI